MHPAHGEYICFAGARVTVGPRLRRPDLLLDSSEVDKERHSGEPRRRTLGLLLVMALVGVVPLVSLGRQTASATWVLAVAAVWLGAVLVIWLRAWLLHRPSFGFQAPRLVIWISLTVPAAVLIGGSPAGVRMIYSAALEGFVCAVAFYAVRAYLHGRAVSLDDD